LYASQNGIQKFILACIELVNSSKFLKIIILISLAGRFAIKVLFEIRIKHPKVLTVQILWLSIQYFPSANIT